MSMSLSIYVVSDHYNSDYYCPTKLDCRYTSLELLEAIDALGSIEGQTGRLVHYGAGVSGEAGPIDEHPMAPAFGPNSLQIVTAAQLLTIPWDALSEDPEGKLRKRSAWAYVATLPTDALLIVTMD